MVQLWSVLSGLGQRSPSGQGLFEVPYLDTWAEYLMWFVGLSLAFHWSFFRGFQGGGRPCHLVLCVLRKSCSWRPRNCRRPSSFSVPSMVRGVRRFAHWLPSVRPWRCCWFCWAVLFWSFAGPVWASCRLQQVTLCNMLKIFKHFKMCFYIVPPFSLGHVGCKCFYVSFWHILAYSDEQRQQRV